MNVSYKRLFLLVFDVVMVNVAVFIALILRFDRSIPQESVDAFFNTLALSAIVKIYIYQHFGLYKSIWRYASTEELMQIVYAVLLGTISDYVIALLLQSPLPRSVYIISFLLTMAFVGGLRMSYRVIKEYGTNKTSSPLKFLRVMIIGAGQAGAILIREMKSNASMCYKPILVIDDNKSKYRSFVNGVEVLGTREDIARLAKEYKIDEIILAIPSISQKGKSNILNICKTTKCKLKIFHGIQNSLDSKLGGNTVRAVNIEDLLGRDEIISDVNGISEYIRDQVVLVTGGGGSIGSEICRQVAMLRPKKLLILDIYENSAYELQQELKKFHGDRLDFDVLIASIRDEERLKEIFSLYKPSVVFHAAAHKHVPLMESNVREAVKNNVFGTLNVARCANEHNANSFVLISSDKAVNPTSVMGATKRIAEMIVQSMDRRSRTEFVAVRFGNVLGSNGSVIPTFQKQIAQGGPVTVTDPNMVRYFMTIQEAVRLVIQAGAMAQGGEIFILDMGKPVKIIDLAKDLIRLSGLEPDADIKIEFVGQRPGEKLFEELLLEEEALLKTHDKIFVGKPFDLDYDKVMQDVRSLNGECADDEELRKRIFSIAGMANGSGRVREGVGVGDRGF
jgi:FlaA1/EpsC-like NDP-sugar epimerase